MPSLFDKISKALIGSGKQLPSSSANSSNSGQSIRSDKSSEESPPSFIEIEDAMSLDSFRKIAEETDTKLKEASEVPIQLLKNYLREINKDEDRTIAARFRR